MIRRCTGCSRLSTEGVASIYWAWYPARDERVAYVSKLDPPCITQWVLPLMATTPLERAENDDQSCALCGSSTGEYPFYMYATIYMPGREPLPVEALLCEGCDVRLIAFARESGKRLPDRNAGARTKAETDSVWHLLAG